MSIPDTDFRRMCRLVSHDLRNPLAAIVTNLEFSRRLLEDADVDPDLTEAIVDSVTACEVLRRLVANFDLLAKGDAVKATIHDTDLEGTLREVAKICEGRAEQSGITLAVERTGDPISLGTDRTLLSLALENLVANALQHAPSGSTVTMRLAREDDVAVVGVSDEGEPVEPEVKERALGVEGHTLDGRGPGTRYGRGLTLLVSRLAAEALGGTLDATTEEGKSVMVLRLPIL